MTAVPALAQPTTGARPQRLTPIFAVLIAFNIAAWAWAVAVGGGDGVLLGAAVLAYVLGLRHAFDADHIAAIDNVTRSLARNGSAPATIGLWFSLGHSAVVVAACAAIAVTLGQAHGWLDRFAALGSIGGTLFSAAFLFAIAAVNIATLPRMLRAWRQPAAQPVGSAADGDTGPRGPLSRLLGSMLRSVAEPRHMFLIGLLFGLGFDTASEIGLLGLSAGAASHAPTRWSIMVLPALFTAGMSLADTTDGAIMARAYGWAFERPRRRLAYNLSITLISVAAALVVAAVELMALAAERFGLTGWAGRLSSNIGDHPGLIGGLIAAILIGCWLAARVATGVGRQAGAERTDSAEL